MMNLLKRMWTFLLGKGHAGMDQIEDPIEKANLKIIDMKSQQSKLIEALAAIKAVSIKHGSDSLKFKKESNSYLNKAKRLKTKYENETDEATKLEYENFIKIALNKYENLKLESTRFNELKVEQDKKVKVLQEKTKTFITTINDAENKLKTVRAQTKAADVNKRISKDLSGINFDGITSQLDGLEEKIEADNIEAESWMELDNDLKSDETRMEDLLAKDSPSDDNAMFSDFMTKKA